MKHRMAVIAGWLTACVLLVGAAGCSRPSPYGQGFRFPLGSEPVQLDPQVAEDTASIAVLRSLMEGLTRQSDGQVLPGVAAQWQSEQGGRVFVFTLRDSVWQDGTPVTAADFVYAWRRAVTPATRSGLGAHFANIVGAAAILAGDAAPETLGVTVLDAKTLRVELVAPDVHFPLVVSDTAFFPCPQTFFEETGGRYGLEKEYVPANGAFALTSWRHGEFLILEKRDAYHAAESIAPSRVRYVIGAVADPVAALQSGALDATELNKAQAQDAAAKGLAVTEMHDSLYALWINTGLPGLENAAVRQALRDGLEWDRLFEQLGAQGMPSATGLITPAALVGQETYRRPENAAAWDANSPGAADRLRRALDGAALPAFTLLCGDDDGSRQLAQYVVQSWQKNLNVYFRLQPLSAEELRARVQVGNYELALYTQIGIGPQAEEALSSFVSDAARGNLSRFHDAVFDERWEAARKTGLTRDTLESLEQYVLEQCPVIPLAFPTRCFGVAKGVSNLSILPFGGGEHGVTYDFRGALKRE